MILVEINYIVPINIVEENTVTHREWLDQQINKGLLLMAGPKVPRTGGIIIALGNDKAKIEELFKEDPFYVNKVADYKITEFVAGKYHPLIKTLV